MKHYVNSLPHDLYNLLRYKMNLKASLRRKDMNPNYYIHSFIIGCHGNSLLHLVWTKKSVVKYFYGVGDKVFWNIYISMIMQSSTEKFDISWFYIIIFSLWNIYGEDPNFN